MSDIEKVKKLREATGAGFKDCNLAIKESSGDLDKAIEILRVKGISKASKKMSRDAKEGVVVVSGNESKTSVIELNYRLTDPQIRQLQALSLLSQGIFINEVGVSMQGITNNLYQKASDVFSNLLGTDNEKLQIGVNYLQGDKSAILDVATEDRLGFTLSTKISEKILLNGKIGVPVGGLEQTLIVGNVQMDFLLNDEGSLKAKVFSKENEFRYIGDELGYTQGLGISYDVDFDTFKSLIKKIKNKESNIDTW